MEKRKAHYDLDAVKAKLMRYGISVFSKTAVRGLNAMGLSDTDGLSVVLGLRPNMLEKSMTTHADVRIWQDVYLGQCPNGKTAYIKLTLQECGALVIQFKER